MAFELRGINEFLRLPEQAADMRPDLRQAMRQACYAVSNVHGIGEVEMPIIPVGQIPGVRGRFVHTGDIARRIDLGVDSWRPEMMAAHEIGHFIDWSALPGDKYASQRITTPSMRALIRRIQVSETWAALQGLPDEDRRQLSALQELFACSYAQWIAMRSGNRRMREQIDLGLASPTVTRRLLQWDYVDFLPIAEALDSLFEERGWLVNEPREYRTTSPGGQ